jgi:hypothetical protein
MSIFLPSYSNIKLKLKILLVRTKFYWSLAGGPMLIVRTLVHVYIVCVKILPFFPRYVPVHLYVYDNKVISPSF